MAAERRIKSGSSLDVEREAAEMIRDQLDRPRRLCGWVASRLHVIVSHAMEAMKMVNKIKVVKNVDNCSICERYMAGSQGAKPRS
jgi:hypothetical protein